MKFRKTQYALAAIALGTSLPVAAQTIEAERMTLSTYQSEGSRIKLPSSTATGTARTTFNGGAGTYNIQVHVMPENDGRPTLEVRKGGAVLQTFTYPQSSAATSFTVSNVSLNPGDVIELFGRANAGAYARIDKIVLTQVSAAPAPSTGTGTSGSGTGSGTGSSTPIVGGGLSGASPATLAASSMRLSTYARESGTRIRLPNSTTTGSAEATFGGRSGRYDIQVYVQPESDGRPTLEVHKSGNRLHTYTYPQQAGATSFKLSNVNVAQGEVIKLVGRGNGGAYARVDKVVLTPAAQAPAPDPVPQPQPNNPAPLPVGDACANPSGGYQGFGRNTTGGAGQSLYRVTNLNDSGAGSLRDALSKGNRCVVFDVGGTINLSSNIYVLGANVTVDGFTAQSPGVTLRNRSFIIQASAGANNVIVRGIRHRGTPAGEGQDCFRVYGSSNVVLDHLSASGCGDGAIDVTENARNVTLSWNILGNGSAGSFTSLVAYGAHHITLHHNFFSDGKDRQPKCDGNHSSLSANTVCDVRNNLIWNYTQRATAVRGYGTGNVVNNYYHTTTVTDPRQAIYVAEGGSAHVSGNFHHNGLNVNGASTVSSAYAAVATPTTDAITAAHQVLAGAGARGARFGLDATDQGYAGRVALKNGG